MCTKRYKICEDVLPNVGIDKVMTEMSKTDTFATEIQAVCQAPDVASDKPEVEVADDTEMRMELVNEYSVPTRHDVVNKFKRTPQQLRMKKLKLRSKGKSLTVYPILIPGSRRLRVVESTAIKVRKHAFKKGMHKLVNQTTMLYDAAEGKYLKDAGIRSFTRIPVAKEVAMRARELGADVESEDEDDGPVIAGGSATGDLDAEMADNDEGRESDGQIRISG